MNQRTIDVILTSRAQQALKNLSAPLNVELELYFSCLIRKRVLFPDQSHTDSIPLKSSHEKLNIQFRPVMTRVCSVDDVEGAPDLETFPIKRPEAFIPHWLRLDNQSGKWMGEFGFGKK